MSALPLRKPRVDDEVVALLREIRDLLRADMRKREAVPGLVEALRNAFVVGVSRFTSQGLLDLAAEDPHGELSCALSAAIDMDAAPRGRAVALGMLLSRLPQVEVVSRGGGVSVYRLRNLGEEINKINTAGE